MTTSFTVALIVLPILFVLCVCLIIVPFFFDWDGLQWFAFWAGILGLCGVLIGGLVGMYPYDMAYHSWRVHQGTVAQISSRLLSAGDNGGSNQKFVVTFRGSPQAYGVNDTRASLVKVGEHLRVTCIRTHQWGGGVDGYDCRWDQ